MHTLFCALGPNEYNRVSLCDNAKEIWEKLKVTYEGTSRVKESKISLLTLDYELFKAKPEERIKEMFDRFTHIINGLKALGMTYPNKEMVKKISANLCLTAIDDIKVTSNSSTLNDYSFDELQDAYDELGLEFKVMMSKHNKNVSN
ncbi:UBN2 domain-containing protein [Gossypium australe]|uniref:UBN2 domain-containing protein n=1 Tax=Gossypium australe TaxID=47621 RepID=A0A5B6UYA2_9ROSI|nr:UBN2 domain-containing protein [Gossypium australe]